MPERNPIVYARPHRKSPGKCTGGKGFHCGSKQPDRVISQWAITTLRVAWCAPWVTRIR